MNGLIIIGASGFGREVAEWTADACEGGKEWVLRGFVDDNLSALDGFSGYPPLLGRASDYVPQADDVFVCAIGAVAPKEQCVRAVLARGGRFARLTHRTAMVSPRAHIGTGVIIAPRALISSEVVIGDFVGINVLASVQHDARVGDFSHLQAHVDVGGGAIVGRRVFLESHCSILPRASVPADTRVSAHGVIALATEANGPVR